LSRSVGNRSKVVKERAFLVGLDDGTRRRIAYPGRVAMAERGTTSG
jgi:hypothetical protein